MTKRHCSRRFSYGDKRYDTKPRQDEDVVCDRCGRFGALEFAGVHLCSECYQQIGSRCAEFGADHLWDLREDSSRNQKKFSQSEPSLALAQRASRVKF